MAENKLLEAFALLGWNIGDSFEIPSLSYSPYTLTKGGLIDKEGDTANELIGSLLSGSTTWHKLPWKPKEGETYYCIFGNTRRPEVYNETYTGCISDLQNVALGNYFRAYEEAEANKDALIAKLKEAAE